MADPSSTQRDVEDAIAMELAAAGIEDAEEIGRGGFGIVYRGTQPSLDRTVAVKVLTGELEEDRQRFFREQQAMGRLGGHPNIVSVLHVGETESGRLYLVMQYHQGGSLDAAIRRHGSLPLEEVLRLGVKIAGALETGHRAGILHRDVKPANILFTGYGEPALTDFGIAHLAGGFQTGAGRVTGSPAFTAPEVISGEPATTASDVYALGATLFSALTGHAAFERRRGEQVVAQFVRIARGPTPDLRTAGIPADVALVIGQAMSHDPQSRPSVVALGQELQRIQRNHGLPVDEMRLPDESIDARLAAESGISSQSRAALIGNLPIELTSFIGRRAELEELKTLISTSRLVTLTGVGGVGKTRLALRAARELRKEFTHGAWLVELGEVRDESLLLDVVAAALGLRDQSARPLRDVVTAFVCQRELLLVLDNCEQLLDAVADFVEQALRACENLHILVTSREPLDIGGEAVLWLSPLACPDAQTDFPLGRLSGYDAVALFAERAASAVPHFAITADNKDTVARICARLEGLPLAIELAAARLRAMSPEQILERLADRYQLLTGKVRGAPARQQTLRWSVAWSYDLCTSAEQRLWGRLSVFAGSFELQAVEDICGFDLAPHQLVDLLSSLIDKSILRRTEADGAVRFRMLETLRDFGREMIERDDEPVAIAERHRDWYQQLVARAEDEWFGPRQAQWLRRLERELPNVREALDFSLSEGSGKGLETAASLMLFWVSRGLLSEGRRLLDRALDQSSPRHPAAERAKALYAASILAALQVDLPAATARAAEASGLIEKLTEPSARALVWTAEGFIALLTGEPESGMAVLHKAVETGLHPAYQASALILAGWAHELHGDLKGALSWYERLLALAESHGESVSTLNTLWSIGIVKWRLGEHEEAARRITQAIELARALDDRPTGAACLEALGWLGMETGDPRFAAVLMGAAEAVASSVGCWIMTIADLATYHRDCAQRVRAALGDERFDEAWQEGSSLSFPDAVALALGKSDPG